MKTPDGRECRYYYEDFHRGRDVQECRSVKKNMESERWQPSDCSRCPVPDILLANADPDMDLIVTIKRGFLGFGRKVEVLAHNRSTGDIITDPYVGNPKDHPGLDLFRQALDEMKDDDD